MAVHPAQRHIMSNIKLEQLIYRIFLLSPFEILQNQQLAATWRVKLYMCSMLLIYITLRVTYCLQFEDTETNQLLYNNGKLWMSIYLFDFLFSSLSFVGVVINGFITSILQIEFFNEIQQIDAAFMAAFNVSIRRSRIRTGNICLLYANLAYYIGYFLHSWTKLSDTILTPYQHFAYFFTYNLDNIISVSIALYYVTCLQLCRERIAIIRKILRNYSNFSPTQMDTVLELFVRIHNQILLINRFMGFVVLLKVAHDFTLGSSIVYMIFFSLSGDKIFEYFLRSVKWFIHTVFGTILIILSAEMLLTEVNECEQTLSRLITDDVSISKQKGVSITHLLPLASKTNSNFKVYSILRLIRHRSPIPNACGLFDIDLRLLFAMICGIISYMIVLLQFQEYDDDNRSIQSLDISWA